MMLNILEIGAILLTIGLVLAGAKEGLVHKLASMIAMVLSFIIVAVSLPYATQFLKTRTPVYEIISDRCEKSVGKQLERFSSEIGYTSTLKLTQAEQEVLISRLPIPERLKSQMTYFNTQQGYKDLRASTFQDYISYYLATVILNVATFVILTFVVKLSLQAVIGFLDLLASLPGVGFLNSLMGGALGLLEALFLFWLFFLVLTLISGTRIGAHLMAEVQASRYLSYLYRMNLFEKIVFRAAAVFR